MSFHQGHEVGITGQRRLLAKAAAQAARRDVRFQHMDRPRRRLRGNGRIDTVLQQEHGVLRLRHAQTWLEGSGFVDQVQGGHQSFTTASWPAISVPCSA